MKNEEDIEKEETSKHICILCGKDLKKDFEIEMSICEECIIKFKKEDEEKNFNY